MQDPALDSPGASLQEQDCAKAFGEARRLKGMMANLALTPFGRPLSALTELLRRRTPDDYDALYTQITERAAALWAIAAQ